MRSFRRTVRLAGISALALICSLALPAVAQQKIPIQIALGDVEIQKVPFQIALDKGIYAKNGLDADVFYTTGAADFARRSGVNVPASMVKPDEAPILISGGTPLAEDIRSLVLCPREEAVRVDAACRQLGEDLAEFLEADERLAADDRQVERFVVIDQRHEARDELVALVVADAAQGDLTTEVFVAVCVAARAPERALLGDLDGDVRPVSGQDAAPRSNDFLGGDGSLLVHL